MLSSIVGFIVSLFELVIIAHVLLSYFLSPYHPIRETIDRLVNPFLAPIRRLVPTIGGFDFTPLVLLIAIQIAGQLLVRLFSSLGF
jgi:YggT family protein